MGKLLNSYQFTVNRHLKSRLGNVLAHVMQAYDGKVVRLTVEEWPYDPQPTLAEAARALLVTLDEHFGHISYDAERDALRAALEREDGKR